MTALTEEEIITDAELTAVTDGALEGTDTPATANAELQRTPTHPQSGS